MGNEKMVASIPGANRPKKFAAFPESWPWHAAGGSGVVDRRDNKTPRDWRPPSAIIGLPNGSVATDTGPKTLRVALGVAFSITATPLAYCST